MSEALDQRADDRPVYYCACGCGTRVTFSAYTMPDGPGGTPVAYVGPWHRVRYLRQQALGGAPPRT